MKKFILFSLAIALSGSNTLFAADTILGKRSRSEAFSDDEKTQIEMRDSNDNVIVSLPIGMEVAKLSNLFAEQLPALLEELEAQKCTEDAQNNGLSIKNVMSQATLRQIIDLMRIYNQIEKENPESSEHGKIRLLYDYLETQSLSKKTLEELLKALSYLDVPFLMNTVHLLLHNNFSQNNGAFIDPEFHPSHQPLKYTQRILLRYAANTPSRDELPSELIRMIPQSFKDINDLKSYLNHPIAQSFRHHSNKAMVRFVRDYIEQALTANSLPQMPELIDQFQAQSGTPLYIALFIEYYLQKNAHGTIAAQLPHASTLSTVADRIRSFKANHVYDALCLDFIDEDNEFIDEDNEFIDEDNEFIDEDNEFIDEGNELSSILGPLCQIIEPLCRKPIKELYLNGNELTSLPAELCNLTNLTELYLGSNQLHSLPAWIGNLTNLTHLSLSCNNLTFISAELGNLTNLTTLWLQHNRLHSLPAELGNLTNLIWLDLSNNELTTILASLNKLGLFVIKDDHVVFAAD